MTQTPFNYICTCALLLAPLSGQAAIILYTAETDSGATVTDSLTSDGSQNGTVTGDIETTSSKFAFGSNSYQFGTPDAPASTRIALAGTASLDLGSTFTMAAAVNITSAQTGNKYVRLFHSYSGGGGVSNFLFDFNPNNGDIRFFNGTGSLLSTTTDVGSLVSTYGTSTWHHFAATYDSGLTKIYYNGTEVASTTITPGANSTIVNASGLFFGEDVAAGAENNTLHGFADDLLIYNQAMNATQIANLAASGAVAAIPEPSAFMLVAGTFLAAIMLNTRRRRC